MSQPSQVLRSDLGALVSGGLLGGGAYLKGLEPFRNGLAWNKWALGALFALGAGHILAGIIFFFAFNWNDISGAQKFLIVQGGIVSSVLLWIGLKLDKPAAQAFGIAATVLIGVLLAVFGQVYQTPAAIYTPFTLWAVLSFPFAAASRSVSHWAVWLAIAVFAALTFIEEGLAPAAGDMAAQWAMLGLSAALLGVSAAYHNLTRTRFVWARTSWFRLAVLAAALCIAVSAFFIAFWEEENVLLWIAALALVAGTLTVIYKKWPTLPALSLTTFALVSMISQFGLKIIFDIMGFSHFSFAELLLGFLWAALMTFLLAKAFRHYQNRFGTSAPDGGDGSVIGSHENAVNLESFARQTGIETQTLQSALSGTRGDDTPWYVDMLLGFAGVITAIFAMLFLWAFVLLIFKDVVTGLFMGIGLIAWAGFLFLRRRSNSQFSRHFFNTLMLGGFALFLIALAIEFIFENNFSFDAKFIFIFGGMAVTLATLWLLEDRIIEFLMAAAFFGLLSYGLYEFNIPRPYAWLCLILTVFAVIGLTRPIKTRIFSAAGSAFLIAIPVAGAAIDKVRDLETFGITTNWIEIAIGLICAGGAVYAINRFRGEGTFRPALPVLAVLLLIAAIMPAGSAGALLIILIGYILGSRALALIGVLLQIYFVFDLYYDMQISLLHKSFLLFAAGVIFVLLWVWLSRKETAHA